MREMKDSGIPWIGKIPKSWEIHPVYFYFNERKHRNSLGKEKNLLSLSYGNIIEKDINKIGGLLPESFNTYNIVEPGDIIIRPTDLQNDKRSLRTGLVKEHGIITSAYIDLMPIRSINTTYYHYLLHTFDVMKVFYNMGNGVRQGLNFSEFSHLMLFEPPIGEQHCIADYLDTKCTRIDSIRKNVEAEIEALKQYKRSVITEAVTKGLDKNVEMKDSGIPWIEEIPENWTVMRTRNIAYISIGLVTTMTANYVGKEEGVPLIRNSNIKCNQISYENMAFLSNKFAIANQNRRLHEGQIVTVHTGDIGTSAIIPKKLDGCLGFATIQSTPNSQFINPKFLCWEYNSTFFKNQCIAYCTGDGRQNLNLYDFINLRVIVPPVHEQLEIASYLDSKCSDIDSIISDKQKQLEILNEYKKSLIYEYVTGKKEVPAV